MTDKYDDVETIRLLLIAGLSGVAVAEQLGVSTVTVSKYGSDLRTDPDDPTSYNLRERVEASDMLFARALAKRGGLPAARGSADTRPLPKVLPHNSGDGHSYSGCAAAMCAG